MKKRKYLKQKQSFDNLPVQKTKCYTFSFIALILPSVQKEFYALYFQEGNNFLSCLFNYYFCIFLGVSFSCNTGKEANEI